MREIKSEQGQNTGVRVLGEVGYGIVTTPQDRFNLPGRSVSTTYPDYFGRKTEQRTQITEIGILADDHLPLVASEVPNSKVRRSVESDVVDMRRLRIDVRHVIDNTCERFWSKRSFTPG